MTPTLGGRPLDRHRRPPCRRTEELRLIPTLREGGVVVIPRHVREPLHTPRLAVVIDPMVPDPDPAGVHPQPHRADLMPADDVALVANPPVRLRVEHRRPPRDAEGDRAPQHQLPAVVAAEPPLDAVDEPQLPHRVKHPLPRAAGVLAVALDVEGVDDPVVEPLTAERITRGDQLVEPE